MLWAWYANRIGVNNFIELYFEQMSIMKTCYLRNPPAAFHARLKRFYNALKEEEAKAKAEAERWQKLQNNKLNTQNTHNNPNTQTNPKGN